VVSNPSQSQISCKKILAVEGLDEKNFFDKLMKDLGITDAQIEDVGGKNKFPVKFPALLKRPGFFAADGSSLVTHLAIIRDKDDDAALESVIKIVKDAGLTPPIKNTEFSDAIPKVGIFIMPGETIEGAMLEDLCLKTIENHPAMKCVNDFVSCVCALEIKPKNIPKAKAQTFLAAQPEIVNSVGLGAQKNYWNFESPVLEELKQFLIHLK